MRISHALLAGLLAAMPLMAQQPAAPTPPQLPAGPLLKRASDFAIWAITTTSSAPALLPDTKASAASTRPTPAPASQQKGPAFSLRTIVTKTKPIYHEETTAAGGSKSEVWSTSDLYITVQGNAPPQIGLAAGTSLEKRSDYSKSDFPAFGWISSANFTGVQKVLGRDCLIFKGIPDPEGARIETIACVDLETRLPVALQGDVTQYYQFGRAPSAMLTLPPNVQKVADTWRKAFAQSAKLPAAP